jgi:hypothetical protein
MTEKFHALLLSELRMVSYQPGNLAEMTDDMLCEAVTVNENLQSLGFTLRPADILRLAASPSLEGFYEAVKALVPDVKDKPMYPGFPQQVMEMDEAEFRLHQMIHYFTTYGLESLLGKEVSKGWLPDDNGPQRTKKDTALMACRVIDLVAAQDAPIAVLKALLNRRERLTNPELELVLECAPLCTAEQMRGLKVRFKENLELLFPLLMSLSDRNAALLTLHAVCAHTGDVFRCSRDYLSEKRWHLTTSEKKLLVKLLESYTVGNLRTNMMQSLHLRERNLLVLQHLDYNQYSRSPQHKEAVRALRNGELLSWHGIGEALLRDHSPEALAHYAERPGYMLRMINRLLSLDYSQEDIEAVLLPHAGMISGHLVVKTIRTLMKRSGEMEEKHRQAIDACQQKYWQEQNSMAPSYTAMCERLTQEAARRRNEAAWKWQEEPKKQAREHAYAPVESLEKSLEAKEKEWSNWKRILKRIADWPQVPKRAWFRKNANADLSDDLYVMVFRDNPKELQENADRLENEAMELRAQVTQAQAEAEQQYREASVAIEARYAEELEAIDTWEKKRRENLEQDFAQEIARYSEAMRTLPARREAELAALEKRHAAELRAVQRDAQTVEVLKSLLKAHFQQAETKLKGKRVYLDMRQFDLAHSTLETEDRSRDGGYIRSGISFRIPKEAKFVRFFVYWNDPHRVDVDLHAAGKTTEGEDLHVGWNADFRNGGVVHSGDVTHSDAAEYIDIDLSAPIREIYANVNLFSGKYSFKGIETCYVGLMAVDQIGKAVRHYDPANCFFTHALTQNTNNLFYGFIDVQNRFVRFVGQPNQNGWGDWTSRPAIEAAEAMFTLEDYLHCVLEGQQTELVKDRENADVILTMAKSLDENAVSLVDSNFFLEC